MPMYGHHMAPTNHQTTPHPSDALYIHAATCLDTLPSIWVLMVNCGGAWWCQELIGCPCRNTSKTKFCSCPCTDTTWPPRITKQPHILLMHSACMMQSVWILYQVFWCSWWPVGEHGGAKSSWGVRVRRRAKSIFAHVHMSGHYMALEHHQTSPDPSNTLYMHAATCLDALSGL